MAALLSKARRSAILRRARRGLERAREAAVEPSATPPPVSVVVSTAPERALDIVAAPLPSPPAPAAPRGRLLLLIGLSALALFAAGAFGVAVAPRAAAEAEARGLHASLLTEALAAPVFAELPAAPAAPAPAEPPAVAAPAFEPPVAEAPRAEPDPEPARPRADAHVIREGYGHIPGGVVFIPKTFSSADGVYDLYLHFHGNTRVVLESAEYAGLDAVVAVVNLGVNSAPYLDGYEEPGAYERTLGAVGRALGERGLVGAHLRRVAVGSWSGGYGAVSRILEHDAGAGSLDAVLVMDGIHCGFLDEDPRALNTRIISPFLAGAKRAARGEILFSITHSEIEPVGYAGTALTAGYLLDAVHGTRGEPSAAPEHVQLRAAEGAVSRKLEKWMEPTSEARVGSFHVRGYRGNTPEHHMAHLLQMGATMMPELAARWR